MKQSTVILSLLLTGLTINASADVANAQKLAEKYTAIAKTIDSGFMPSESKGEEFFNREITIKGKQVACASCHTSNPADQGKHIVTGKPIRPLAPSANEKRFSSLDKVEKNFTKHCNDIIGRDCTAEEKSNFISFLLSVK